MEDPKPVKRAEEIETQLLQSPDRVLAEAIVKHRYQNMRRQLFSRAKVLLLIIAISTIFAVHTALALLPKIFHDSINTMPMSSAIDSLNLFVQISTISYFLLAKNPAFAKLSIKILIFVNIIIGFVYPLALVNHLVAIIYLVLLIYAYTKIATLDFGGD